MQEAAGARRRVDRVEWMYNAPMQAEAAPSLTAEDIMAGRVGGKEEEEAVKKVRGGCPCARLRVALRASATPVCVFVGWGGVETAEGFRVVALPESWCVSCWYLAAERRGRPWGHVPGQKGQRENGRVCHEDGGPAVCHQVRLSQ
jgi:hypothetical protein